MSNLLKFNEWMPQICQTVTKAKAGDDKWMDDKWMSIMCTLLL